MSHSEIQLIMKRLTFLRSIAIDDFKRYKNKVFTLDEKGEINGRYSPTLSGDDNSYNLSLGRVLAYTEAIRTIMNDQFLPTGLED